MKAKQIISGIAAVSTLVTSLTIGGCQSAQSQQSGDLMENIKAAKHDSIKTDDKFKQAYSDFSVELFKKSFSDNQNTLISPLSVTLALAMTANGANGQTKIEMETLLGKDIPLEQLNSYLCGLTDELTSDDGFTLCTANSIWFRDDEDRLKIENNFLQTNADYYKAADLLVLPTESDVWGLVINEAMACGLPVVTTNRCVAGLELVEDGINGYLVPVNDREALAEKLRLVLSADYREMGERSLEKIRPYTLENMAKSHVEIFENEG